MKTFILIAAIALLPTVCFGQSIYYLPEGQGCGTVNDSEMLVKKGDIYYHPKTNTPYSGTARHVHDCHAVSTYEMKNGKRHGKYTGGNDGYSEVGYYKNGNKDGIWKYGHYNELDGRYIIKKIESYKDGKLQVLTKEAERSYLVKDSLEMENNRKKAKQQASSFLQKNKSAAGVVSTKSGLQYKILTKGSGDTAKEGDTVTFHYIHTLLDGTKMGSTHEQNQPATMVLSKNRLSLGYTEVLLLMKKGEKVKAWLPGNLYFGEEQFEYILLNNPAYALFIFDMELLDIKTAKCDGKTYNSEIQFCYKTTHRVTARNENYEEKLYDKCGDLQYNPERQFCHTDKKLYDKCNTKPYNPETQICRSNSVYDKCGDKTYNSEYNFCHADKVYNKCGDLQYNPETHYCRSKDGTTHSCGNKPYDPDTHFCHTDKAYLICDKPYNPQTHFCYYADKKIYAKCGDFQYFPETQFCHTDKKAYLKCDDSYNPKTHFCRFTDKKIYERCGDEQYDPETQFCHTDKKVYLKCDESYDLKTQFCYLNKVYDKCGGLQYNPDLQTCNTDKKIRNKVESIANTKCDLAYDSKTHFCHTDNKAYIKCAISYSPETQFCYLNVVYNKCRNIQYNPEMHFCHTDNNLYLKCELPYNPETHFCHYTDKKVYVKCSNSPYNPDLQFCHTDKSVHMKCGGKAYNPETHHCRTADGTTHTCGNKPFDPQMHQCNNNKVSAKCGNEQYNPETHVCHSNTLFPKCGNAFYVPQSQFCQNNTVKACDVNKIRAKATKDQTLYVECLKTAKNANDQKKCADNYVAKSKEPCER
ncbi:MAG: FKBP-type peptidyl-prolyl cis-trans isomerase [Fibromonadales bacterium]|nr:FKBP-type peptidyl-prolyl cis-trans isomerase [Fibromonadales bacterium]